MISNQNLDLNMIEVGEDAANYPDDEYLPFADFVSGAGVSFARLPNPGASNWINRQVHCLTERDDQEALGLLIALGEAAAAAKAEGGE